MLHNAVIQMISVFSLPKRTLSRDICPQIAFYMRTIKATTYEQAIKKQFRKQNFPELFCRFYRFHRYTLTS